MPDRALSCIGWADGAQNKAMNWLWAGIGAAVAAWQLNKIILRLWGERGTVWVTPTVEEILKTSGALLLHGNIILTHGVFGAIEAVYDLKTIPRKGFSAALASLLGHLLFGAIAGAGFLAYGAIGAVGYGAMGHLAWNVLVALLAKRKR